MKLPKELVIFCVIIVVFDYAAGYCKLLIFMVRPERFEPQTY